MAAKQNVSYDPWTTTTVAYFDAIAEWFGPVIDIPTKDAKVCISSKLGPFNLRYYRMHNLSLYILFAKGCALQTLVQKPTSPGDADFVIPVGRYSIRPFLSNNTFFLSGISGGDALPLLTLYSLPLVLIVSRS